MKSNDEEVFKYAELNDNKNTVYPDLWGLGSSGGASRYTGGKEGSPGVVSCTPVSRGKGSSRAAERLEGIVRTWSHQ